MKKKFLAIVLCLALALGLLPVTALASEAVDINAANFPDPKFRDYVRIIFDGDQDGRLSQTEIDRIGQLNLSLSGISSLKGIEYFSALTYLDCSNNQLTELDLSQNRALQEVYCPYNQLASLELDGLEVTSLACHGNEYEISVGVSRTYELTQLPGKFDPARASLWAGAQVEGTTLVLEPGARQVTYQYDLGGGHAETFTLKIREDYSGSEDAPYTLVLSQGQVYQNEVAAENLLTVPGITCSGSTYTFAELHFASAAPTALKIMDEDATLVLMGENTLSSGASTTTDTTGLYARGDLTVMGEGSLEVRSGDSGSTISQAVEVSGVLTLKSGSLKAITGACGNGTIGAYGSDGVRVEGGRLTAVAGKAQAASFALGSDTRIQISGGTVIARAGEGAITGAIMGYQLQICGGSVQAEAVQGMMGYGLVCAGEGSVTGGAVTVAATTAVSAVMANESFTAQALITENIQVTAANNIQGVDATILTCWAGDGSDAVTDYKYMKLEPKTESTLPDYTLLIYDGFVVRFYSDRTEELTTQELEAMGITARDEYYIFENVSFVTTASVAIMIMDEDPTVELIGTNYLCSSANSEFSVAVATESSYLTLVGSGSLTAVGTVYGLDIPYGLTLRGPSLTAVGQNSGVNLGRDLVVEKGSLEAIGGDRGHASGIATSGGSIYVKGGSVKAQGGAYAIATNSGSLEVTGGSVILQGGESAVYGPINENILTLGADGKNVMQVFGSASADGSDAVELTAWAGDGSDRAYDYKYMKLVYTAEHIHSGGSATCVIRAVCDTCGQEYGDLAGCSYDAEGVCRICGKENPNVQPTDPAPTDPVPTEPQPTEPETTEPQPTQSEPANGKKPADTPEESFPWWILLLAVAVIGGAAAGFVLGKKKG